MSKCTPMRPRSSCSCSTDVAAGPTRGPPSSVTPSPSSARIRSRHLDQVLRPGSRPRAAACPCTGRSSDAPNVSSWLPGVVQVVLAVHDRTLRREQVRDRVADRDPAATARVQRTGRVHRDELEVDPQALVRVAAPVVLARRDDVASGPSCNHVGREEEVEEARARRPRRARRAAAGPASSAATIRSRDLARRRADLLLQRERDVRLEVAVLAVASSGVTSSRFGLGQPGGVERGAQRGGELVGDHGDRSCDRMRAPEGSGASVWGTTSRPLGAEERSVTVRGRRARRWPVSIAHAPWSPTAHSAPVRARARSVATNVQIRAVPPGSSDIWGSAAWGTHVGRGRRHVRRQGGLGRTLADSFRTRRTPEPHPVEHHFPDRASDAETDEPTSHQDEDPGEHPGVTDDDAPDADMDPPGDRGDRSGGPGD